MQSQEVVAALQRVTAKTVRIESGAPGNEDARASRSSVEESLEVVAPAPVLVHFIEHPKLGGGELTPQYAFPILGDVPVEISAALAREHASKSRLAHLTGSGHEYHLPGEVTLDLCGQVSGMFDQTRIL